MTSPYTPETLVENDLIRFYRRVTHSPPVLGPPGITQRRAFLYPPDTVALKPLIPNDHLKQSFMNRQVSKLPVEPAKWKGTRFLGSGAVAMAGLWEWIGSSNDPGPPFRQVVVKELLVGPDRSPSDALEQENEFLPACSYSGSQHLLRMLQEAEVIESGSAEGLGLEWDGIDRRLFLEYCSVGSLQDLLQKRITEQKSFAEKSPWLIFNCLVDGMIALGYGIEHQIDPQTGNLYHPGQLGWWKLILHFDIKSDNLLVAHEPNHYPMPILKFADFNLAAFNSPLEPFTEKYREALRKHGTEDYFTPEQFTEEWDFSDYKTSQVAGQYSFSTNIWGVAAVMHQIATLSSDPPSHREPFLADWNPLLGSCPTYGLELRAYPYSDLLKDLIFECLSEKPSLRPDLLEFKTRVLGGYGAAFAVDPNFELYEDCLQPDPIAVTQPVAAQPAEAPPIRLP